MLRRPQTQESDERMRLLGKLHDDESRRFVAIASAIRLDDLLLTRYSRLMSPQVRGSNYRRDLTSVVGGQGVP